MAPNLETKNQFSRDPLWHFSTPLIHVRRDLINDYRTVANFEERIKQASPITQLEPLSQLEKAKLVKIALKPLISVTDLQQSATAILIKVAPLKGAMCALLRSHDSDPEVRLQAISELENFYQPLGARRLKEMCTTDVSWPVRITAFKMLKKYNDPECRNIFRRIMTSASRLPEKEQRSLKSLNRRCKLGHAANDVSIRLSEGSIAALRLAEKSWISAVERQRLGNLIELLVVNTRLAEPLTIAMASAGKLQNGIPAQIRANIKKEILALVD